MEANELELHKIVEQLDDGQLHELACLVESKDYAARLAHDREMFALKTRATIVAVPVSISVVYFLTWLIGGMTGHPAPPPDKIFLEILGGVFGAAVTQLGTSYVEAKRQQRKRRRS